MAKFARRARRAHIAGTAGPGAIHPFIMHRRLVVSTLLALIALAAFAGDSSTRPVVERLSRGVVAIHQSDGSVFVGWRLLADDPDGVAFNIYREVAPRPAGERGGGGPRPPGAQGQSIFSHVCRSSAPISIFSETSCSAASKASRLSGSSVLRMHSDSAWPIRRSSLPSLVKGSHPIA
jgi:hypothetical protein